MAAPNEPIIHIGLRRVDVFGLNANNTPAGTGATAYEGKFVKGSTAFDLTAPDTRKITGLGEDGITGVFFLPPNEGASAVLHSDNSDPDLAVLLDGTKVNTLGEFTMVGMATDRQGFEPQVALMMYQMAVGLTTGKNYWHTYIAPSAKVIRKAAGMLGDKAPLTYNVAPTRVNHHLWGVPFTMAVDGYLSTQFVELWSNYQIRLAAYVGDGTVVDFSFPVNFPAVATTGIKVFVDDVEVTTGITKLTTKVTFTTAPALAARIVILREIAG